MAKEFFTMIIMTILVQNYVLVKFLGICPFLGVSKKTNTALAMGMAVTFVMGIASAITYFVQILLVKFHIEYLQTIAFILVIACLVQLVEMAIMKLSPPLYSALGIYLPLITTNCAVLGVAILNIQSFYGLEMGFLKSVVNGVAAALSFTLAIWLFAGIRERLDTSNIPEFMKGVPIALISAGLVAMAFLGFSGLQL